MRCCQWKIRYASKRKQLICKICVHHVLIRNAPHFYGLPLDLCGRRRIQYYGAFCQTCHDFCQTRRNLAKHATFSWEKCRNPSIVALYKMTHFQEVRRTRKDKRGARYAMLISAAAARFVAFFWMRTVYR